MRAVKTPDEIERIAAACAVADRALAALLPEIRAGRHRARPRPPPRVADPDRRRRGARVRRRLPGRARGRAAARRPGRPARAGRCGPAVRLRRAGGGLPQRHDAHPVRGRAGASATCASTTSCAASQQAAIDALEAAGRRRRRCPDGRELDAIARGVIDGGRAPGRPTGTGWVTGSASPPTRSRASPARRRRRRCPARPCSPWSPGSTSRARPASGSRTSSTSTPARGIVRAAHALPARRHRAARLTRVRHRADSSAAFVVGHRRRLRRDRARC